MTAGMGCIKSCRRLTHRIMQRQEATLEAGLAAPVTLTNPVVVG